MSPYEKASVCIQTATGLFVAIALLFYYRQARAAATQAVLLKQSLDISTYATFEATVFELSRQLIAHSAVRPYFYDRKDIPNPTDPDFNLVMSFALFYLDFFDHVITVEQLSPGATKWSSENWNAWMQDLLKNSPTLRAMAMKEEKWYNPELANMSKIVSATIQSTSQAA